VQTRMRIEMRTLVERASRWLVTHRRPPLDSQGTVEFFRDRVQAVMAQMPNLLTGRELDAFESRKQLFVERGQVPEELAARVAVLHPAYQLLFVLEIADREGLDPVEVTRVHFALAERLGLPMLVGKILALPRDDRWQTMARATLRDDLYAVHAQLTAQVLRATDASEPAPARIATWEEDDAILVARAAATLEDICADDTGDLARMSVGLRVVRGLLSA
jgi:glutamate dehydrogenase